MAVSTRSLPDCSGRCSCSQTAGVSAMAAIVSGRRSFGCGLVKRTRRMPSTAADRPQQVGEQRAAPGQVAAVGVDVLAEEGDLGHAPAGQVRDLGDQVVERPADLGPAHRRHDAEGARVVTARLDGHPGRVRELAHGPTGRPGGRAVRRGRARRGPRPPGPRAAAWRRRAGARVRLCVPKTTSTWPARWRTSSRSFWARQPPTAICRPGSDSRSAFRWPRWP